MDKASKVTLKAAIVATAQVGERLRVSVCFDDGTGDPWFQPFDIKYDRPISLEEFAVMLSERSKDIKRPTDPYKSLIEAREAKTIFEVNLD